MLTGQALPSSAPKFFNRAPIAALQPDWCGASARNAANDLSMALSSTYQSSAARGFKPASAESQKTSNSLMWALAVGRLPLSTMAATSVAMRNADRSPSLEAVLPDVDAAVWAGMVGAALALL